MHNIGFIGFGEAAQAFTQGWRDAGSTQSIATYDLLFDAQDHASVITARCAELNVAVCNSAAELAANSEVIIAAVTADQVGAAAASVAQHVASTPYLDINSAAPEKKKRAASVIGAHYLDVAVLSPVHPGKHRAPILVGGATAHAQEHLLTTLFPNVEIVSTDIGVASLIKMIRSIFVKGIESVAIECALAACQAGLAERIFPSLDVAVRFDSARELTDYTTQRVATHGIRRAAEMEEVRDTLNDMGLPSAMASGAITTQRLIGELQLASGGSELPYDAQHIAERVLAQLQAAR